MLVSATEMINKAHEGHYAIGAFNINNLEWTKAILAAAEEAKSPVMLGVSEGAAKYMCGFKTVAAMVKEIHDAMGITVPVALHLDHGSYEGAKAAIEAGFTSVMFDGSHYAFEENLEKSKYEADGSLQIQGTTIPYHTICEDNFFVDEENNPVASIFSYAYFRSDIQDNSKRPILFIYNGGPGCASLWLHMGLFGPRIVKLDDELNLPTVPPFELEDNLHCLLDLCDLVFIDPVGTGLGRLIQEKARKEFYETHGDVRSVSKFIEQFLARYNRRNSPVLLAGESYGTTRSALLAGELMGAGPEKADTMGISVSGIFLLGSYFIEKLPVEASATDLITMAATNYFHNPKDDISQKRLY